MTHRSFLSLYSYNPPTSPYFYHHPDPSHPHVSAWRTQQPSKRSLRFHFCPTKIHSPYSNHVISLLKIWNGSCLSHASIPSMASHHNEKNNSNFLPKRLCLIWPLITFWTSSGTSLPSLLFSLPHISQAPSLSFDYVLPCVWNPLSHVWLLCGSLIILKVMGRHFETTRSKQETQSFFSLDILFFSHIVFFFIKV